MEFEVQALICGIRKFKKGDKVLTFVDWYAGGAKTSLVPEKEIDTWESHVETSVPLLVNVQENQGKVYYRIRLSA